MPRISETCFVLSNFIELTPFATRNVVRTSATKTGCYERTATRIASGEKAPQSHVAPEEIPLARSALQVETRNSPCHGVTSVPSAAFSVADSRASCRTAMPVISRQIRSQNETNTRRGPEMPKSPALMDLRNPKILTACVPLMFRVKANSRQTRFAPLERSRGSTKCGELLCSLVCMPLGAFPSRFNGNEADDPRGFSSFWLKQSL